MEKEYKYEKNMKVVDHIINELMIVRTIQDIDKFDEALAIVFLSMFPVASGNSDIIEGIFNDYCQDYTVKDWYNSLFKTKITKR